MSRKMQDSTGIAKVNMIKALHTRPDVMRSLLMAEAKDWNLPRWKAC